jgi:uncharacterized NAD-dependent epimerase/dehydratase family protein
MLKPNHSLVVHFDDQMGKKYGKMGHGVLRFTSNRVVGCIDRNRHGENSNDVLSYGPECPVVEDVAEALLLGGQVLVLGMAPSGGRLTPYMLKEVDRAVEGGLSVINGLHQTLADRYSKLPLGQWIWDIRKEPENLGIASGRAASLSNRRLLMIGTDMAIGKMTSGIEIWREALRRGVRAEFLATGQIGICVSGRGIPLDAIRIDYACGAVEQMVLDAADMDLQVIEGQGSIMHPGSASTLPLLRGSCPTHLVLCHQAGNDTVAGHRVSLPPLLDLITLYEDIASACGGFPRPKTIGIALNTSNLDGHDAGSTIKRLAQETGLPVADPLRFGVTPLVDALLDE